MTLEILKISEHAILPTRAHPDDAGLDLYGMEVVKLPPGDGVAIRTGIAVVVPQGHVGMIADRSSLAKIGIKSLGGVIDSGYRGEVKVLLRNLSKEPINLNRGDRIAQLLISPIATPSVLEVSKLGDTSRATLGFGSSGR